ncbi:MAG: hypothetical protein KF876_14940 [Nitrospira sp.]|nr:hypothetical protein [Nitrospira sp.]MDR4462981.1 hypothetical protein [Nitrospira sp.]
MASSTSSNNESVKDGTIKPWQRVQIPNGLAPLGLTSLTSVMLVPLSIVVECSGCRNIERVTHWAYSKTT